MNLTLEKAIEFCEFEADRIRKKQCSEWIDELRIEESANRFLQLADWLRELKKWRTVRNRLSQNRITTSMYGDVVYGDVVMWNDIKRVIEEVEADDSM